MMCDLVCTYIKMKRDDRTFLLLLIIPSNESCFQLAILSKFT